MVDTGMPLTIISNGPIGPVSGLNGLNDYFSDYTYRQGILPEFCTEYRSEALQAAVNSWCKIQVLTLYYRGSVCDAQDL